MFKSESLFVSINETSVSESLKESLSFSQGSSMESVKQLDILYRRFGHPSDQVHNKLMSICKNASVFNKERFSNFYSACQLRKNHKLTHKTLMYKTKEPLHLLHPDL